MTKPRPRFFYCFSCDYRLPDYLVGKSHTIPGCDVREAIVSPTRETRRSTK